ncbi:hypothetical protein F7U66_00340 [Vibrio parahaemolyticus]|nr:hypothetical protein [Vibrio parahaemolyticus]
MMMKPNNTKVLEPYVNDVIALSEHIIQQEMHVPAIFEKYTKQVSDSQARLLIATKTLCERILLSLSEHNEISAIKVLFESCESILFTSMSKPYYKGNSSLKLLYSELFSITNQKAPQVITSYAQPHVKHALKNYIKPDKQTESIRLTKIFQRKGQLGLQDYLNQSLESTIWCGTTVEFEGIKSEIRESFYNRLHNRIIELARKKNESGALSDTTKAKIESRIIRAKDNKHHHTPIIISFEHFPELINEIDTKTIEAIIHLLCAIAHRMKTSPYTFFTNCSGEESYAYAIATERSCSQDKNREILKVLMEKDIALTHSLTRLPHDRLPIELKKLEICRVQF